MAKRKFYKLKKFTIPIAVVVPFGGSLIMAGRHFKDDSLGIQTQVERTLRDLGAFYTGFDYGTGTFKPDQLINGLVPMVVGLMIHKFVGGELGMNRALAQAGVPIIRL